MFGRSRRNLARWFTLSMGSILIVFAGAFYYLEVEEELETLDALLYKKTRMMAANAKSHLSQQDLQVNLDNVPFLGTNVLPVETELVYARWYDRKGELVQFFGIPPTRTQSRLKAGFRTLETGRSINTKTLWLRQVTLPVYEGGTFIGYLQAAIALNPIQNKLNQLRVFLAIGVTLTLGAISLVGWVLGGIAMQPIREAYERLQQFTANASHELRAPLAAILSNAQVGLLAPVDTGEEQRLRLEKIVDVAKSMSGLVTNLLFLARYQGALPSGAIKDTDITSLLKDIAETYHLQATAQDLTLTSTFPEYLVKVKADPDLLRLAVVNLLSNACKYTGSGGQIYLRLFTRSHRVVIEVEDTGIGIDAAELGRIFEPFYRVDKVRSRGGGQSDRKGGGFGLGLAIVKQIVKAHNGEISVTSKPEIGSKFQIQIPLSSSL